MKGDRAIRLCTHCGYERPCFVNGKAVCDGCKAETNRFATRRYYNQTHPKEGYRVCGRCGRRWQRPPRKRAIRCPECERVHKEVFRRVYRATHKPQQRAYERDFHERAKDPYVAAQIRERRRLSAAGLPVDPELYRDAIAHRLRLWLAAQEPPEPVEQPYRPAPRGVSTKPLVPAEPIARWLRREFRAWQVAELAEYLREDDSHLGRIINGTQQVISLHVADRIFTGADCTHLLSLLYPEAS